MEDLYIIKVTGVTGNEITGTTDFQLPIYLEQKYDNMGVMVGFDGEIEQIEQVYNFSITGVTEYKVRLYNTTNVNDNPQYQDAVFNVDWGDDAISGLTIPTRYESSLKYVEHTYSTNLYGSTKTISLSITTPWGGTKTIERDIKLPFTKYTGSTEFDQITFTAIPYVEPTTSVTQDYIFNYKSHTGYTPTNINFMAVGASRINEFAKYGTTGYTSSVTATTEGNKYVIDNLTYLDTPDGYTYISGTTTSGTTVDMCLTRNEILIGFTEEPQIYSDIFIERGKQSLMERNLRLNEIDNMGELEIYGGGFFNVKKQ